MTFLASAGDFGATNTSAGLANTGYPSMSPGVISVGGTTLSINNDGTYGGESTWNDASGAGGGGISQHESQPSFQSGKVNGASTTNRVTPDVSIDADMSTGMYVINTTTHVTGGGLFPDGGTSFGAPMWAGLIALADQDRALNSLATLSTGAAQSALYGLPAAAFRDVTAGNNGYAAATGYDMASGLGTPLANVLVPALAGVSTTTPHLVLSGTPSSTIIAGGTGGLPSFTADIENTSNAIITSDNSAVTLSVYYDGLNNGAELTSGNVSVNASSGVADVPVNLWLATVPNHVRHVCRPGYRRQ